MIEKNDINEINNSSTKKTWSGNRFGDFVAGFSMALIYLVLVAYIFNTFERVPTLHFNYIDFVSIIFYLIILIYLFRQKYKYMAWGFLFLIVLPLLLFGACIVIFTPFRF